MPDNILSIVERIGALGQSQRELFERLFDVRVSAGELVIPEPLATKVARWYARAGDDGPAQALDRARRQTVVRVFNRWTGEGAVFNPLRALRPLPPDGVAALDERVERARGGCDFCDPLRMTTADAWGRLESRYCTTAANAAKFDAHHGLIVFKEHHPLRFEEAAVIDFFDVAERWFARSHAEHPGAAFPFLAWNCLEKAAASQTHGHLQVLLSSGMHQAQAERLRRCAAEYGNRGPVVASPLVGGAGAAAPRIRRGDLDATKGASHFETRDYFADLITAHHSVGLCQRIGPVTVMAHLTPIKEREVLILAPPGSSDLPRVIARVLRAFTGQLGVTCFNVGILYPPSDGPTEWNGFPIVARIVDRGPTGSGTVDIGGMELYGTPVVASDPYDVIAAVGWSGLPGLASGSARVPDL